MEGRLSIAVLAKLLPLNDPPNSQVGGAIVRRKQAAGGRVAQRVEISLVILLKDVSTRYRAIPFTQSR